MRVLSCEPGGIFTPQDISTALADLQAAVGGFIEFLDLPGGFALVLNETGKLDRLAVNAEATRLFSRWLLAGDVLVGRVLFVASTDEGELVDLPETVDPTDPLGAGTSG